MTAYRKNVIQIEVSEFDYVVHTVGGEDLAVEAGLLYSILSKLQLLGVAQEFTEELY